MQNGKEVWPIPPSKLQQDLSAKVRGAALDQTDGGVSRQSPTVKPNGKELI